MVVIMFNVCTHLWFLLSDVFKKLYLKCRYKTCAKLCAPKAKINSYKENKA